MVKHIPVLQKEVIEILAPKANKNFIDATLGYGGHASLILENTAPSGKLLAIEQDEETLIEAKSNLQKYADRVIFFNNNFTDLGLLLRKWKVEKISGILIDLGPNTKQLKSEERGLSFSSNAELDMRLDKTRQKIKAKDILNKYSETDITRILQAGEEKFAKPIARKIIHCRRNHPIERVNDLLEIIKTATPPNYRYQQKTHFATATFRALRIAVNDELNNLKNVLPQAVKAVSPGGRIVVISFHSLEDRIVKNFFRECAEIEILNSKPIIATDEEIAKNPSARSAKMRGAIKKF